MEQPIEQIEQPILETKTRSPFITIWYKPRGTIRRIVDTNPKLYVLPLAAIGGIVRALDQAAEYTIGDQMSIVSILVFCLILGPIGGIISLYISSLFLGLASSFLGGTAKKEEIRAGIAWSSVPDIATLIVFLPVILLYGRDWFSSDTVWMDEAGVLFAGVLFLFAGIVLILTVWKAFIFIKCLAEVNRFSSWRAIATILVLIIPLVVVVFGCVTLTN